MVIVEPTGVISTEVEGEYRLVPYLERRKKWGVTASAGYSSYEPINYEPDFVTMAADEVYSSPDTPMILLSMSVKRNAEFGSLGGELMVGIYNNNSDVDPTIVESTLQLIPIYLGLVLNLDAFSGDPYFVPYVSGGLYTVLYKEEADTRTLNGNTQVAPYLKGGVAFLLDWLDKKAARTGYEESGVQSSYLYAEAMSHMESSAIQDKDFSNDLNWGLGVKVEF